MAKGKAGFEGWYFRHQLGAESAAFIPGRAESGAFVQMLWRGGARQFDVPEVRAERGVVRAGACRFSRRGAFVDLPGVRGEFTYGPLTPLRGDIMGPFRFLPMECRHGVVSMAHPVSGALTVDGETTSFDGGRGYIEKDAGTSFPSSYLWLQCNDFSAPCALLLSVAEIPMPGFRFTGCICAVVFGGREYRLATYNGVKIHAAGPTHICLSRGRLLLEADVAAPDGGQILRSPVRGQMTGLIRESCGVSLRVRLWDGGEQVFDLTGAHGAFEYVRP